MCGRTPTDDGVRLQVDHKIPQEWGGTSDEWNLETLCNECNAGKKAYFSTFDSELMRAVLQRESVYIRLGETLRAGGETGVDARVLEFVGGQRQWDKRLRELRELGWEYRTKVRTTTRGSRETAYFLIHAPHGSWPADPGREIRRREMQRKANLPDRSVRP